MEKSKKIRKPSLWRRYKRYRMRRDIWLPFLIYRKRHDILRRQKKWWRNRRINKQAEIALRLLRAIDIRMIQHNWSRPKRRRFWRAFRKSARYRSDVFDLMEE